MSKSVVSLIEEEAIPCLYSTIVFDIFLIAVAVSTQTTHLKTESIRKLNNFIFQWTKSLYQNNLKNIAFLFYIFQGLKNAKFHKNCENTGKIVKISSSRRHFVNIWHYIIPGSREKFYLVLLKMTNCENVKKNEILFKLFWYKVFVLWKLKLLILLINFICHLFICLVLLYL